MATFFRRSGLVLWYLGLAVVVYTAARIATHSVTASELVTSAPWLAFEVAWLIWKRDMRFWRW